MDIQLLASWYAIGLVGCVTLYIQMYLHIAFLRGEGYAKGLRHFWQDLPVFKYIILIGSVSGIAALIAAIMYVGYSFAQRKGII